MADKTTIASGVIKAHLLWGLEFHTMLPAGSLGTAAMDYAQKN
jgi:hypothetical protein